MLTLLDERIGGIVRERILISYLRYKGQTETPLLDEVCKLCRKCVKGTVCSLFVSSSSFLCLLATT